MVVLFDSNVDHRISYCVQKALEDKIDIFPVGEYPLYRDFDTQLKYFLVGREAEKMEVIEKFPFGKHLERLSDKGILKAGTVTNATPCCSPHNFGMAFDCKNSVFICKLFNSYMGYECFITGQDFGDTQHIEIKGFKLPKFDYRWSCFCSPLGYKFLEKIGGLQDD